MSLFLSPFSMIVRSSRIVGAIMSLSIVFAFHSGALAADPLQNLPLPDSLDHLRGPSDATITLVEYASLECPFCKMIQPTLDALLEEEKDVNLVFRHFPLDFEVDAREAAIGAECMADVGGNDAFWAYIAAYFGNQDQGAKSIATTLGYNIDACLKKGDAKRIERDLLSGANASVDGIPTVFIINNKTKDIDVVRGAQPLEVFTKILRAMEDGTWKRSVEVEPPSIPSPPSVEESVYDQLSSPISVVDPTKESIRGKAGARFHIVTYMNFAEPFSQKLYPVLQDLVRENEERALIMRTADLSFLSRSGMTQARAFTCAGATTNGGAAWNLADFIMDWKLHSPWSLTKVDLERASVRLGAVHAEYRHCIQSKEIRAFLDAQTKEFAERFSGVPATVIIDTKTGEQRVILGAQERQEFEKVLAAMAKN